MPTPQTALEGARETKSGLPPLALVLGGGNALGAYHAGLYEALEEGGIEPDWIVGTSIGAVNGAIIAGNPREQRLDRLRSLWNAAGDRSRDWPMPWDFVPEDWRRTGAVMATLLGGRPGLFGPIASAGAGWHLDPATKSPALYDTQSLPGTLAELVDFDLLNRSGMRFTMVAVDIENGEEVIFDTSRDRLTPGHLRASAAMLAAFPAVEIDGRLLGDGGLSMNLPIDPVLSEPVTSSRLCIAADLLPLSGRRPATLGEVIARMQDLAFAAQSRRTIEHWRDMFDARGGAPGDAAAVTLVRLAYTDQDREVAGKAMDFSPESVRQRWVAGLGDGRRLVARLHAGDIALDRPGLTIASG